MQFSVTTIRLKAEQTRMNNTRSNHKEIRQHRYPKINTSPLLLSHYQESYAFTYSFTNFSSLFLVISQQLSHKPLEISLYCFNMINNSKEKHVVKKGAVWRFPCSRSAPNCARYNCCNMKGGRKPNPDKRNSKKKKKCYI